MAGHFEGINGLPQHFFKALCQDTSCKEMLGGFHVPCVGGTIVFVCPKCRGVSVFQNQAYEIASKFVGRQMNRPK